MMRRRLCPFLGFVSLSSPRYPLLDCTLASEDPGSRDMLCRSLFIYLVTITICQGKNNWVWSWRHLPSTRTVCDALRGHSSLERYREPIAYATVVWGIIVQGINNWNTSCSSVVVNLDGCMLGQTMLWRFAGVDTY